GSGTRGQTYLYWKNDRLFELPVSWWRYLGWVNSPGYKDGEVNFSRPIIPRCLECHATYFDATPPPNNRYRKTAFMLGITCEKCHGPGEEHVERQMAKDGLAAAKDHQSAAWTSPTKWPRERQMDLCAWCHAGAGKAIQPAFSYPPGASLAKYVDLPKP